MNTIRKADVLGYLAVLNCPAINSKLSVVEKQIGQRNITGCYIRLMESLEKAVTNGNAHLLYKAIQEREYYNARLNLPLDDPRLVLATARTASMLFEYLRDDVVTDVAKSRLLNELEEKINEILEKYNASLAH